MDEIEKRVSLCAAQMTLREPFIATIYTKLERKFGENGTAATNGKMVYFGTKFAETLSDDELFGVSLHEALHVIFEHSWRRGDRHPALWNIANDAIINRFITGKGYSLPAGCVEFSWVTDDMSSEEVYEKLKQQMSPEEIAAMESGKCENPDGTMVPGMTGGGGFDGKGDLADAESQADLADLQASIQTAAKMAKACGDKSSLIDRILGKDHKPIVKWTDVLRHLMTSSAKDDYSYRRPNKRFVGHGLYLPSLWSDSIGKLVVAVDTSGSMGEEEMNQCAAEIRSIVEDCHPECVEVIYCDSKVAHVETFQPSDPIHLHPKGGGGTAFKPVFDYVAANTQGRVAALIYLTDMCTNDLDEITPPSYPVLWGVTYESLLDMAVPFGQIVKVAN